MTKARVIAFAKWSLWVKKCVSTRHCSCSKKSKKTANAKIIKNGTLDQKFKKNCSCSMQKLKKKTKNGKNDHFEGYIGQKNDHKTIAVVLWVKSLTTKQGL